MLREMYSKNTLDMDFVRHTGKSTVPFKQKNVQCTGTSSGRERDNNIVIDFI